MTREDIFSQINKKLNMEEDIKETDRFKEDLHFDSIDLVEMLTEIEGEFDVEISDEDAVNVKTVGDFIDITLKAYNE